MDELQKSSDTATQENGLLRAQVERLQVELREYRKRLSWMSSGGSGLSAVSNYPNAQSKGSSGLQNNEFLFDFPKFGDLPGAHLFNGQNKEPLRNKDGTRAPGVLSRDNLNAADSRGLATKSNSSTPNANTGSYETPSNAVSVKTPYSGLKPSSAPTHDTSTSDSPSSSSDSHQSQMLSSSGTSPEPSSHSHSPPDAKNNGGANVCIHGSIDGEESFCARLGMACGNIRNPVPAARDQKAKSNSISSQQPAPTSTDDSMGFDWLAQQNGGQFDPVLFGDWREPQDAVLSQDFGSFFNDAFPLPDLGSPSHNLTEAATNQAPKKDLLAQIDSRLDEDEVVPGEDKAQMLSCTKIWYVLWTAFQLSLQITKSLPQGSSPIDGEVPQRRDRCRQSLHRATDQGSMLRGRRGSEPEGCRRHHGPRQVADVTHDGHNRPDPPPNPFFTTHGTRSRPLNFVLRYYTHTHESSFQTHTASRIPTKERYWRSFEIEPMSTGVPMAAFILANLLSDLFSLFLPIVLLIFAVVVPLLSFMRTCLQQVWRMEIRGSVKPMVHRLTALYQHGSETHCTGRKTEIWKYNIRRTGILGRLALFALTSGPCKQFQFCDISISRSFYGCRLCRKLLEHA